MSICLEKRSILIETFEECKNTFRNYSSQIYARQIELILSTNIKLQQNNKK